MSYPRPYTSFGEAKLHKLIWEADGVLRISFNRGAVNAWIEAMWRELDAIMRFVKVDPDVNAIVLSGENRCFTAGLDCECKESSPTCCYAQADWPNNTNLMGSKLRLAGRSDGER